MVVSKKIKSFLRTFPPKIHCHVDFKTAYDTYFVLSHHFKMDINDFLGQFLPKINETKCNYQKDWLGVKENRLEGHKLYEDQIPYSDFMVFSEIFHQLPQNIQLQLSNSATIRYAQLFDIAPSVQVFCN